MTKETNKRGVGPTPNVPAKFASGNRKTSAEATEKRFENAKQAAGGKGSD